MRDSIQSSQKLIIGVLNIMPAKDREATEKMFERRFEGFEVEVLWLHPEAEQSDFIPTKKTYHVPTPEIYQRIDYLFRSGANAEFRKPAKNRFLQCLRDSLSFDKGSTSFCWSAGQIYADATGQSFSSFLSGRDGAGDPIKHSGYFDYKIEQGLDLDIPSEGYMACSRHFQIHKVHQKKIAEENGFQFIATSKNGPDVAGVVKGKDILLFTHNEYDPDRLYVETERCIEKAKTDNEKTGLRAKFESFKTYEDAADEFGQTLFRAILQRVWDDKYPASAPAQEAGCILKYA